MFRAHFRRLNGLKSKSGYCVGGFRLRFNALFEAPLALPDPGFQPFSFKIFFHDNETDVTNTRTVPDPPPGSSPR